MAEFANVVKTFTAGEALAAYTRVRLSAASGTSVVYADATEEFIGVTEAAAAINESVAVKLWPGAGTFKIVAAGAVAAGAAVYTADDGEVNDVALGKSIGRALSTTTADQGILEVAPMDVAGGLVYRAVAASTALSDSTTETILSTGTYTLPVGALKAGDVLKIRAQGTATATNSTDTLTVKLYVGTEEICTTGAVDSANGDIFYIDAMVVVRTSGSSATLVACGVVANGVIGTVTAKPFLKASASEDLSGAVAVTCKGTWSVASASNSCRLDVFTVEHLPA